MLTFRITLPDATYPTLASYAQFFRDYVARIQQQPGIVAAGGVSMAPVTRAGFGGSFTVHGRPEGADEGNAQIRSVTPGYMEALRIPLRAGRFIEPRDSENAARVALISETAARRFWPGENPVGKQLRLHVNEPTRTPREIVGIVGDVRTRGLELDPVPVVYVPPAQYGAESMTIMVRTSSDPMHALPQLKAILKSIAPGVALSRARTLEEAVAANVAEPRFRTLLLSIFAIVSLALAAVGLYGVVAFSVNQRRAELGLRIALGADPSSVRRLVLRGRHGAGGGRHPDRPRRCGHARARHEVVALPRRHGGPDHFRCGCTHAGDRRVRRVLPARTPRHDGRSGDRAAINPTGRRNERLKRCGPRPHARACRVTRQRQVLAR